MTDAEHSAVLEELKREIRRPKTKEELRQIVIRIRLSDNRRLEYRRASDLGGRILCGNAVPLELYTYDDVYIWLLAAAMEAHDNANFFVPRIFRGLPDEGRERTSRLFQALNIRLGLWGAQLFCERLVEKLNYPGATPTMEHIEKKIALVDAILTEHKEALAELASLPFTRNWRALLVPPYNDPMPWFLFP